MRSRTDRCARRPRYPYATAKSTEWTGTLDDDGDEGGRALSLLFSSREGRSTARMLAEFHRCVDIYCWGEEAERWHAVAREMERENRTSQATATRVAAREDGR